MQAKQIVDKFGRIFEVAVVELGDGGFRVSAFGKQTVAYANCLPGDDGTLRLMDIHVEKGSSPGRFTWRNFLRLGKAPPLRNSGIGHQLLSRVLSVARQSGFRLIRGDIAGSDLEKNPALPDWYRRQGFTVERGGQFGEWTIVREV